ncbi:MAG: sensor histidine kinase [Burkholderiales bacterium]
MLHEFLTTHRTALIRRCRFKVAQRLAPTATDAELEHGIPLFLDQLTEALRVEQSSAPMQSRKVPGPAGGGATPVASEIVLSAALHGFELLKCGFTVDQVVHGYGDLCQAITDLAYEQAAAIEVDEFRTLNRCLDDAIAGAVTEFSFQRDILLEEKGSQTQNERLGCFVHELRNLLNTATLAVTAIKAGNLGVSGATGAVLDRSLIGLRTLIDRSMIEVRASAGAPARLRRFSLASLMGEIKISAALEAQALGCEFSIAGVQNNLAVDVDRELFLSAMGNLLQNAFKFTAPRTKVSLSAHARAERILIEVADHCGGLPPGKAQRLFVPFTQGGRDRSGVGLGLSIARRAIEANQGTLGVRDVPGVGCVFTIDLPRHTLAGASVP